MSNSLEVLQDILWKRENLNKLLSPYALKFVDEIGNENMINTLLYGSSRFVTRLIARKHILKDEKYCRKLNTEDTFYSHSKFIEFNDVDPKTIIQQIKSLCMTKTIMNKKQVIIIHDLPKSVQIPINKLIEKFSKNLYVVLTFTSLNEVCQNIKSSFSLINCNYTINKTLIKQLYALNDKEDFTLSIKENDIVNIAYQVQYLSINSDQIVDNIETFIIASIKSLIKSYKSDKFFQLVKEICYKCTGSVISIQTIIPIVLQYMIRNKYDISKICEYLEISSKIEHDLVNSNKIVFSFEYYFLMVTNILQTKI